MAEVGAFEAKTQFSKLLERVRAGESITITHRGVAVATLGPVHDPSADVARARAALATLRAGARRHRGEPITREEIRDWIEEGRR